VGSITVGELRTIIFVASVDIVLCRSDELKQGVLPCWKLQCKRVMRVILETKAEGK